MCQMMVYIALLSQKLCYMYFSIKIIYIELIIYIQINKIEAKVELIVNLIR
jgi:hypothetical protein